MVEVRLCCPLCGLAGVHEFACTYGRTYFECSTCGLIFLAPAERLDSAAERAHYTTHENDPSDTRYRAFLSRLTLALVERLSPGTEGLDYGSGPGPTLSVMLAEQGFLMTNYDPFFAPDDTVLQRSYDFITATETVEHFHSPGDEFARLDRLLRAGGWLGVMTEMMVEERPFVRWHYPRDPTHVSFYRSRTMQWIASRFGWLVEFPRVNVVLFHKR